MTDPIYEPLVEVHISVDYEEATQVLVPQGTTPEQILDDWLDEPNVVRLIGDLEMESFTWTERTAQLDIFTWPIKHVSTFRSEDQ